MVSSVVSQAQQLHLNESPWITWAEQLQENFAAVRQHDPGCKCHVLIDPSLNHAAEDEAFAEAMLAADAQLVPIEWSHPKLVPEHRPALITVDISVNPGGALLSLSMQMAAQDAQAGNLQQGRGQRIAGWLLSSARTHMLAQHLGAMAVQTLPDELRPVAGRRRLLRFFDPLVLPVLWGLSDAEQRTAFMGSIKQWCLLECGRELHTLSAASTPIEPTPRAVWRAAQWRLLLSLDAFNPAAIGHGFSDAVVALRPTVLATLDRLGALGVHAQPDLQSLASLAIKHHPEFDQHPEVRRLLTQRASDQSASMALAVLTASDWQRIAAELNTRAIQR